MTMNLDADTVLRRAAAACMAGAAVIHFGVTAEHFAEWWLYGVFFLLLGTFQMLWAAACWRPVPRPWLYAGVAVNAATLVLWLVTRTTGLPLVPHPFTPEAFGTADLVCGAFESAAAVLAILAARPRAAVAGGPGRGIRFGVAIVAGAAAIVLVASGTALAAPSEDAGGGMAMAGATPSPLPSVTPGGMSSRMPGAMPATGTGNGNRMDMPDLPDVSGATTAQTAAAKALVDQLEADTAAYRNVTAAQAAGFDVQGALATWRQKNPDAPLDAVIQALHVPNPVYRTATLVDPAAPQFLIYRRDAAGSFFLIGVMFTAEHRAPPAVYLPYLRWHFHVLCVAPDGTSTHSDTKACPAGSMTHTSGYMAHVWFVSDTDLQHAFAMSAPMPQLRADDPALG